MIKEYLEFDNLYSHKFDKYIVLYQNGSFYEIFSIESDPIRLKEISNILNIVLTKKDKSKPVGKSSTNAWMIGFPTISLDKYLKILINNNYTVPVYNQYDSDTKKSKIRKLYKIYSITTYIDENIQLNDYNNITSIYIENINNNYIIGLSTIDIVTSKNNIYEIYINNDLSINKIIEELNRYLIIYNPKEILYNSINLSDTYDNNILHFLNNFSNLIHNNNTYNKEFSKINYQNLFLQKIFTNTKLLTPIEYINMERHTFSLISYIILLNFIYEYDNTSITNISKPIINNDDYSLICHNNAIYQLNIIGKNNNEDSLFKYINYTSTLMGKRRLKYILTNPITDIDELNIRYTKIDIMKSNEDEHIKYESFLKNIIDIERYHNKLKNNDITPNLYCRLNESYKNIIKLIKLSKKLYKNYYNYDKLDKFIEYYNDYIKYFNLDNMQYYINNTFKTSIFNNDIFNDVDNIVNNIKDKKEWMYDLTKELSELINNSIILEFNDKSGYYMTTTNTRYKTLKTKIKDIKKYDNLVFDTKLKNVVKITSPDFTTKSYELLSLYEKLNKIIIIKYKDVCIELYDNYSNSLNYINTFISDIDIIKSQTKLSLMFNYNKPIIENKYNDKSFIQCTDLRHPIIEQIIDNVKYVPNDVTFINDKQQGMLLYGLNGCGKCFKKDTKLIMYDGTLKYVQDIKINDKLMGNDSTPRNVLSTTKGKDIMYEISNEYGDKYTVNKEHILCLKTIVKPIIIENNKTKTFNLIWFDMKNFKLEIIKLVYDDNVKIHYKTYDNYKKNVYTILDKIKTTCNISVKNYLKLSNNIKRNLYSYKQCVNFKEQHINLDPYILGKYLGNPDEYINNYIKYKLKELNVLNNLHIPYIYKCNTIKKRQECLIGILDTKAILKNKKYYIHETNINLVNDILYLTRSLGYDCYYSNNIIKIYGNKLYLLNMRNKKIQLEKYDDNLHSLSFNIFIKKLNVDDYYGFETDGNHQFLLDNFIVTHNSSYMKSIGINIILAQAGLYVSADNFVYQPYKTLFTRINKNDDLFKGKSSFEIEILELKSILQFSNHNSLVLGDEIVNTTEHISSTAIISTILNNFLKKNISFIFASHEHNVNNYILPELINKLYIGHLDVNIDNNKLIYLRKLKEGIGHKNYGLLVANYLLNNNEFEKNSLIIQNKILNNNTKSLIDTKKSKYNSKLYVNECYICINENINHYVNQSDLDVHHIDFQCNFNKNENKRKNHISNLVTLCKFHHNQVHLKKIDIYKWIKTSDSLELDYKYNNN